MTVVRRRNDQDRERAMDRREPSILALSPRVHLFVRPGARGAFTSLFRDTLGCQIAERDFGLQHPVLLVSLSDRSRFSAEFTGLAPEGPPGDAVSDDESFRGAWLEFRTTDLAGVQQKLRSAGVPEFRRGGSTHAYFVAPGGQVFRLVDVDYEGP
jgi:hypothetical protein